MRTKTILALIVVMVFTLGVVGLSFAADSGAKMMGTVTKVDGAKITVKDSTGKETTIEDKTAKDIKAGDKVTVMNGKVTKEAMPKKKKIEGC